MSCFRQSHDTRRYPDERWPVLFGAYAGIEAFALDELQRAMQSFIPYVMDAKPAATVEELAAGAGPDNLVVMGTLESNHLLASLLERHDLSLPDNPEGYTVACVPAPWDPDRQILIMAGRTPQGLLYGVEDFNTRILGHEILRDNPINLRLPESLPSFRLSDHPRIAHRGIWTWGYVVYDYRAFLDNMARLRMNMLTIWNDCPPVNMPDIIAYARNRGIQIILGFPWGWGMEWDLASAAARTQLKEDVLSEYEEAYSHLDHDGIYFQTLTETNKRTVGGRPRAKVVCELVNEIAAALLDRHPDLHIQFGLHATSILDDYPLLASLDKRVIIAWEDAGVIPYAYNVITPKGSPEGTTGANRLDTVEATIDYSCRIAALRPDCRFALVPKGFAKLRWGTEFEHHGGFVLGERSQAFMQRRLAKEEAAWQKMNALWLTHYPDAARFFRAVLEVNPADMTATALVEDGLFERTIQPCVALFSQILWNPAMETAELMSRAYSAYLGGRI